MKNEYIVSIITVSFNTKKSIEDTILSVLNQSLKNFEYIIIDGGSSDGTVEIIKKYSSEIDYWISEKDNGIYDAMNKGIKKSRGRWIYFLNSGDKLYSKNVIEEILGYLDKKIDVIVGNVIYDTEELFIGNISKKVFFKNTLHHQGTLYSRKIFDEFIYSSEYKILADYDLNLYLYEKSSSFLVIDNLIARCESGGISQKIHWGKYLEEIKIKKKYFKKRWLVFVIVSVVMKFLWKTYKQILGIYK